MENYGIAKAGHRSNLPRVRLVITFISGLEPPLLQSKSNASFTSSNVSS